MANNELSLDFEVQAFMDSKGEITPKEETVVENNVEQVSNNIEDPKEENKEETKEEPREEKRVPLAALQEERKSRQELERKLEQQLKEQKERELLIEQRLAKLSELNQPEQVREQIIDPDKDALGALKAMVAKQQQLEQLAIRQQQISQAEQERNRIIQEAARLESEFVATKPDYVEASKYLMQSRAQELQATGYDNQQIQQILNQEGLALAAQAIKNGRNPAESVYAIAKARGYAVKSDNNQNEQTFETDTQKLTRIQAGQDANKSLSNAGGAASSSGKRMDAKTLANLSDAEFSKVVESMSRTQKREIFGG